MNNTDKALLLFQTRRVLPGILIAIGSTMLVVWLYLGSTVFAIYDKIGTASTRQTGTVTNVVVRSVSRGNPDPAALVTIRVGSEQGVVNTHLLLHIGQKLKVECRTGRSGVFYIDYFAPVTVTP